MTPIRSWRALLALLALGGLAGCTQTSLRISPDFGNAVIQNAEAQIADPDARYVGIPKPGSNGERAALAQLRYRDNAVIPPSTTTASSGASIGRADNGTSAGASAGTGASTGMSR